jgi:hypothetical protein
VRLALNVKISLTGVNTQIGECIMPRLQPVAGTEIVDDIRLGHTWNEYNVLKDFILNENPKWFIEVGVHEGGLSYLLLPELDLGYIGIEIDCVLSDRQ